LSNNLKLVVAHMGILVLKPALLVARVDSMHDRWNDTWPHRG
jgi:hypothetical protein